jgi:hypothetical protein
VQKFEFLIETAGLLADRKVLVLSKNSIDASPPALRRIGSASASCSWFNNGIADKAGIVVARTGSVTMITPGPTACPSRECSIRDGQPDYPSAAYAARRW